MSMSVPAGYFETEFDPSLHEIVRTLRHVCVSAIWTGVTIEQAIASYGGREAFLTMPTSFGDHMHMDSSILQEIREEKAGRVRPVFSRTLSAVFSMAVIQADDVLRPKLIDLKIGREPASQFLRHIRNACSHGGRFKFNEEGIKDLKKYPPVWRGKRISLEMEGTELFFSFIQPADVLTLLSDLSVRIAAIGEA